MKDDAAAGAGMRGQRIAGFARFFKSYMSVAALVAASVPIPVASMKLIPTYAAQRGFLGVYASLFCFLLVALVFSIRHALASRIFAARKPSTWIAVVPVIFILLTVGCIAGYHWTLEQSLDVWRLRGVVMSSEDILSKTDLVEIPYALRLAGYYLGIFVFAEAAFVLMAMREYLQDLLHLDDRVLVHGVVSGHKTGEEPGRQPIRQGRSRHGKTPDPK